MDENAVQDNRIPLYYQIYDTLRERIEEGAYMPGDQIPTEAQLSADFGVSRITVKHAIRKLVQDGMLYRKQGKGTFVCQPKVNRKLNRLTSFSEEMLQKGIVPSVRVLDMDVVPSRRPVADALSIVEGEPVVFIRRLRLADGEITAVQSSYVPEALAPGLAQRAGEFSGSLYKLLYEHYGLSPAYGRESYAAIVLGIEDAYVLGISCGSAAFAVKRTAFLSDGRPVEYVESLLRGDKYVLDVELQAPDM